MTPRFWLRLVELLVPVLLLITILVTWRADRRDRAQLATQLAAAQQTISEAASRQKDRDAAVAQTLSQLAELKKSVVTPAQILRALPQTLSLPAPITLEPTPASASGSSIAHPPVAHPFRGEAVSVPHEAVPVSNVGAQFIAPSADTAPEQKGAAQTGALRSPNRPDNPTPKSNAPNAIIPSADLKPLYDFALDCQACQAKLAAAQDDLADEKTKSAALTNERDAAIRAAKGGSALRRIARAAKWFVLGAAAGALASKAATR